jgi:hypothetical protein
MDSRWLNDERGAIFPLMLFMSFIFIALAALVLTYGHTLFTRHLAQNAVDSSAVAAVSMVSIQAIYSNPWDTNPTELKTVVDPVSARAEAEVYFENNASVLRQMAHTVTPTYTPVGDNKYLVECLVILKPIFGDSDSTFTVRSQSEVQP